MKICGSVLQEKSSFKMLGLSFSCKLGLGSYIVSAAKTASEKIGAFIRSIWRCLINYKNGYVELLVLNFLSLMIPWLIVEM